MKIALAQINPTVGDIAGNRRKIIDNIASAREYGASLVAFPELALVGYPPRDLLLKPKFVDDNLAALEEIAAATNGIEAIVGYVDRNASPVGRPLHNSAALLREGKVVARHHKTLLPTYDVFDEARYFEPGPIEKRNQIAQACGRPIGITVCEDLWNDERMIPRRLYHQNPIAELSAAGADVVINCSASPYVVGKHAFRVDLFGGQAREFKRPIVFVNQVGGNDELVFDGNSMVFDADGQVIALAKDFEEDLLIVEIGEGGSCKPGRVETPREGIGSIHEALVLGLRDYLHKCGFKSAVIGLSGGIDSAVTCALAVEALGKENVTGVAMPSRYSSEHSVTDAKALADNFGIEFHTIAIAPAHQAMEGMLSEVFAGRKPDVTEENIQARVRGNLLMAMSNKFGHLLLTTGNKSELAVGYCTLYGDMCGGLAVISDVPKTDVYKLAEYVNRQAGRDLIPRNTITKPPSAELREDQKDSDSLPDYAVLDAILHRYVELEYSAEQIIADGYDGATVRRVITLTDRSEYKRRQAAPGLKVTSRAFGVGRRMPIAQRYRQA